MRKTIQIVILITLLVPSLVFGGVYGGQGGGSGSGGGGSTYTFSTGLTNTSGTITADLSTGRSGGQYVYGGIVASEDLSLSSTSNSTKGKIYLGTSSVYDEVNNRLGIGTTSPNAPLHIVANDGTVNFQGTGSNRYVGFNLWDYAGNLSGSFQYGNPNAAVPAARNTLFIGPRKDGERLVFGFGVNFTEAASFDINHRFTVLNQMVSSVATGTAPFSIASTTLNTNLNADMLDGHHASDFVTTTSGTNNYLAKFSSGGLANSIISDDGSTALVAGNIEMTGKMSINGVMVLYRPNAQIGSIVVGNGGGGLGPTGGYNTFVGIDSGAMAMSGAINNTAVGWSSLGKLTYGANNTSVGTGTSYGLTTGNRNTVVGNSALYNATTQSDQIAIGYRTMFNVSSDSHDVIGIGNYAGTYWGTSGNNALIKAYKSIYIGNNTRALDDQATNEIVIGDTMVGGGSNTVTIGNSGTTTTYLKGNVGINSAPSALIDAQPDSITTSTYSRPYPGMTTNQRQILANVPDNAGVFDYTVGSIWIKDPNLTGRINPLAAQKEPSTVYIYGKDDLPTAIGGVITLADSTRYVFSPKYPIVIDYVLALGNQTDLVNGTISVPQITVHGDTTISRCNITGTKQNINLIEFTGSNLGIHVIRIEQSRLIAGADPMTFFSLVNSSINIYPFTTILDQVAFISTQANTSLGTISNCVATLDKLDYSNLNPVTGGWTFYDNLGITIQDGLLSKGGTNTTLFNFGGTAQGQIQLEKLVINNSGANTYAYRFNTGTTFSGVTNHMGSVFNASRAFALASYTQETPEINFSKVQNIPDSTTSAEVYLNGNTATTTVPDIDAWTFGVPNVAYVGTSVERTQVATGNGAITYTGVEDVKVIADASIYLYPSSGTNLDLSAAWSVIHETASTCTFNATTDVVTRTAHGLANGTTITFRHTPGTLPSALGIKYVYYVINAAADTFQLSYTAGGPAVLFTDSGSGANSYSLIDIIGSISTTAITSSAPRELSPHAMPLLKTGRTLELVYQNNSNTQSINIRREYKRIKK